MSRRIVAREMACADDLITGKECKTLLRASLSRAENATP
jgi:hypothetical protein